MMKLAVIFVIGLFLCDHGEAASINNVEEEINEVDIKVPRVKGATFYKVHAKQGRIMMNEDIEVNTFLNFVRVDAPQMGKTYSAVTLFHDYNLHLTLSVFADQNMCMLMRRYPDIPEDINLWFDFKYESATKGHFDGNRMGRYKTHRYSVDPTPLNHTAVLTSRMQDLCPQNMLLRNATMLTMEELTPESDLPVEEDAIVGNLLYLPYVPAPGERVKRRADEEHDKVHQCSQTYTIRITITKK